MTKMWKWLKKEFREILPVWLFFACAFFLLSFTLSEFLSGYHVELAHPHEYAIGALIMAKVVPMVDAVLENRWLADKPLIYPTLWNTWLYFTLAVLFHHLEQFLSRLRQHLGFAQALAKTVSPVTEPRYWAIMAWLFAIIFAFCAFRQLARSIGSQRLIEMFFGRRPPRRSSSAGAPPAAA